MIPEEKIEPFINESHEVVQELYMELEKKAKTLGDLILFLENGHRTNMCIPDKSPYVIGPGEEFHDDKYRVEFYLEYLKSGGKEKHKKLQEEGQIDNLERFQRFSLFLELMIYCHLWENQKNLRELKQVSRLLQGKVYDWDLIIPNFGRSKIIREDIRDEFIKLNLKVGQLIQDIYRGQIRNAFAHSQFSFMPKGNAINLGNYDGKHHNIRHIKINEWEDMFLKSTLFFHQFLIFKERKRKELGEKNPVVKIDIPTSLGRKRQVEIYWYNEAKSFSFTKPSS